MDIDRLISSVFVKNPLWDQKDPKHHNRYVLDKLWDDVAGEMQSTRSTVRTKWKTLRDTFRKELRKVTVVKHSGDEYSEPLTSSWPHFKSLYFLKDQFTMRPSGGNLPDVESCSHILDEGTEDINETQEEINIHSEVDETSQHDEPILTGERVTRTNTSAFSPVSTAGRARKRKRYGEQDDFGNTLINLEKTKLKLLENQSQKESDEDKSFFDSLLPHIRPLAPQQKFLLRMKIQKTVYNFVYGKQPTVMEDTASNSQQPISQHNNLTELRPRMVPVQDYSNPSFIQDTASHSQETASQRYNVTERRPRMMTVHEYSNPPSVASYLSGFSEDTS